MNLEEVVKILRDITSDDLLNCWEGGEEEYNAIQTVLNYIDNSISKKKLDDKEYELRDKLWDLQREYNKIENNEEK